MQDTALADKRAWTAASIDNRACWYYALPGVCLDTFERAGRSAPGQPLTDIPGPARAACARALLPVSEALEKGRGFAIIEGPAGRRLAPAEARLLYGIVGQGLGQPVAQDVQGTLLYEVRDTGQEVAQGARFSVTHYESSFHTDSSFGEEIVDYVGLLCLQTAKAGGRSQVLSGHTVYKELAARHAELLEMLMQPFHVDRRGGMRAGEAPTVQFPVIHQDGLELAFRYLRYWIEAGHARAGRPLTAAQLQALNLLDEITSRADLRVEFDLQPGQMFFINNRWILHNRTAFEDYPELERRRHLLRLWLRRARG
jgi:alpha-ketoglutarate-dependent taurine dioxygenase